MKNCTGCKYADWNTTKSGGLHPSGDGKCTYLYTIPELPACKYWIETPRPSGSYINRKSDMLRDCAYYTK